LQAMNGYRKGNNQAGEQPQEDAGWEFTQQLKYGVA